MYDRSLAALVGLPDGEPAALIAGLAAAGVTLACAESLTGGLLTALLTEVPGASAVVRGGLVVYATDLKHSLAYVGQRLLDERGPVDPEVALELARGARVACGASVGVGLTGVAGPDPQHGIAVGTWFVAISVGAVSVGASSVDAISADSLDERSIGRSGLHDGAEQVVAGDPATDLAGPSATRAGIRAAAVRAAVGLLAGLLEP